MATRRQVTKYARLAAGAVGIGVSMYFAVWIFTSVVALVAAAVIGTSAVFLWPAFIELLIYGQMTSMISIWRGNPKYALERNLFDMREDLALRRSALGDLIFTKQKLEARYSDALREYPNSPATSALGGKIKAIGDAIKHQQKLLDKAREAIDGYAKRADELVFSYEIDRDVRAAAGIVSAITGESRRAQMRQIREDAALSTMRDTAARAMADLEMSMHDDVAMTREAERGVQHERRYGTVEAAASKITNSPATGLFAEINQKEKVQR